MTLIGTRSRYEVHLPTSGGKAGKGFAVTSSLQIRRNGMIVKQIRFKLADGSVEAVTKAKAWIDAQMGQL